MACSSARLAPLLVSEGDPPVLPCQHFGDFLSPFHAEEASFLLSYQYVGDHRGPVRWTLEDSSEYSFGYHFHWGAWTMKMLRSQGPRDHSAQGSGF